MNIAHRLLLTAGLSIALALAATTALAASCVDNGCHQTQMSYKYLHGPLAAEEAGMDGCNMCHVPEGAPCTASRSGSYKMAYSRDALCISCHEKSESPSHVGRVKGCIKCHSSHGSNKDSMMLRD